MENVQTKYDRERAKSELFERLRATRREGYQQLSISDVAEIVVDAFAKEEALSLADMIETNAAVV